MWSDTDPAGIVWFGVFFRYFEHAEEDLYRRLGSDRTALLRRAEHLHAADVAAVAAFDRRPGSATRSAVGVGVAEITDRRIGFAFDIHERGTGRLICEASYRVACVDATTFAAADVSRRGRRRCSPRRKRRSADHEHRTASA